MLAALRIVLRLPLFEPQEMLLRVRAHLYWRTRANDLARGAPARACDKKCSVQPAMMSP